MLGSLPQIFVRISVLLASVLLAGNAAAQSFVLFNFDGVDEGFNDPTMRVSDIDGQMTTLGQDRLDCFAAALTIWAGHLGIVDPVKVGASMEPLGGEPTGAILGAAGPEFFFHDWINPDPPVANMLFPVAQANQLAGVDLDPGFVEIGAFFNSDIDLAGPTDPLGATVWYYGVDGNPPVNTIDFFSTVLHEMGHGLGFVSLMNETNGSLGLGSNVPDIFTDQLESGGVNYTDPAATNADREAFNISGDVNWKGAAVVAAQGAPEPMYAPNPLQLGSSISHWDPSAFPNLLMEPFASIPFTDISLEREAFEDMLWPLISFADPLDADNIYVDFGFVGEETGAQANPFDTMSEADAAANPGANIFIAPGATTETGTFAKSALWQSTGGTVRIGGL